MRSQYIKHELDGNLRALNKVVVIRKLEEFHENRYGDIIIPQELHKGFNLTKGKVEAVGKELNKYGLKPGMIVLYDHFAGHYLTHPLICVDIDNVICIIEEE